MPKGSAVLGSYERWAQVIGGILETAEIPGFLANHQDFEDRVTDEDEAWRTFVQMWWHSHHGNNVLPADLLELARSPLEMLLGDKSLQSKKSRLSRALKKRMDRVFAGYQICRGEYCSHKKAGTYRLIETD